MSQTHSMTQSNQVNSKEKQKKNAIQLIIEIFAVIVCSIFFLVPFYFIIVNAMKNSADAAQLSIAWPTEFRIWENIVEVIQARDYMLLTAFFNSTVITVVSIVILIFVGSMAAFVLHRRVSKLSKTLSGLFLAGLMIPPAVVPTIWVLEQFGIFKSFTGIILVEAAIQIPFTILLYTGFIAAIPKEIDEAAIIDGTGGLQLFTKIIFPMLKPVHSTVIILNAVTIFNDFVHPLYFFPGSENATVQLTLYNFMSMFNTDWNLLFANVLLITIPPFILFLFFSEKIVSGMAAGAVKG
ncbi:raffinose/stachyose/melibiose transport system permease protein [Gracilibacillus halotolerans]|uniref:Raffinose/stachyose/melibiose transport system permease protein n=1 Tax=Gracilibacillus halotolerans TaxID=74386 RepID=A0A841RFG9_9BACI|nr:carbohydrate ABC transporter permease [Gracilibacillus halotolerans]MBB6512820.1 raffinose/stachyose/melibiose transport system permease protein [Gracilibacillus halotolerans]